MYEPALFTLLLHLDNVFYFFAQNRAVKAHVNPCDLEWWVCATASAQYCTHASGEY